MILIVLDLILVLSMLNGNRISLLIRVFFIVIRLSFMTNSFYVLCLRSILMISIFKSVPNFHIIVTFSFSFILIFLLTTLLIFVFSSTFSIFIETALFPSFSKVQAAIWYHNRIRKSNFVILMHFNQSPFIWMFLYILIFCYWELWLWSSVVSLFFLVGIWVIVFSLVWFLLWVPHIVTYQNPNRWIPVF